jgi:hypothetical protein
VIELIVGSDESVRCASTARTRRACRCATSRPRVLRRPGRRRRHAGRHLRDKAVKYEVVVKVMDSLQRDGVQRVACR